MDARDPWGEDEGQRQEHRREEEKDRSARDSVGDGIRQGLGVLTAFKEALEETIAEARERGDLSPERGRAFMRDALARAQSAAEDARERFDFATRKDVEELEAEIRALQGRIARLEDHVQAPGRQGPGPGGHGSGYGSSPGPDTSPGAGSDPAR